MKTESQMREALDYYRDLAQRAHAYWDEWTGNLFERDRRYELYIEYKAKRDALVWALGDVDNKGDMPMHTVFPPDYEKDATR